MPRDCDMVIGLGGGSVLDTGKAIAALVTNPGDIFDYLEVIGKGQPLVHAPLPYIAIPTTAGTGSEVTRNAVIESTEQKVKVSLRSPLMLPRLALVDPELTYNLPPEITASFRVGCAHTIDRAIRFGEGKPDDRCDLPRRDASCGTVIETCLRERHGQSRRVRECHWQVSLAGWLWQTRRWEPCTDLQGRWVECCTRRMELCVHASCHW